MNVIAAVDACWGIGKNNQLLVSIPADMKFFRSKTMGKVLVMGRKTLDSFPGGMPLKGRTNIVLTGNQGFTRKDVTVCHSLDELSALLKQYESEDVFVAGGGSIYRQLLPWCDTAYITKIDHRYDADTYFPDLDKDPQWELAFESEEQTCFDMTYHFCTYKRKA